MKYTWNIRKWLGRVLIPRLCHPQTIAFFYTHLKPLQDLHLLFLSLCSDLDDRLKYNGQTLVMQGLLNDKFDAISKRIRIETDSDFIPAAYLSEEASPGPFSVIVSETEPEQTMRLVSELDFYKNGAFTVYVPASLAASEELIKGWVKYYKAAGTYFTIIYI